MGLQKILKRTVELTAAVAAGAYVYNKAKEYQQDIEVDDVAKAVIDDLKSSVLGRVEDVVEVYKDVSYEVKESINDFVHYEEIDNETEELFSENSLTESVDIQQTVDSEVDESIDDLMDAKEQFQDHMEDEVYTDQTKVYDNQEIKDESEECCFEQNPADLIDEEDLNSETDVEDTVEDLSGEEIEIVDEVVEEEQINVEIEDQKQVSDDYVDINSSETNVEDSHIEVVEENLNSEENTNKNSNIEFAVNDPQKEIDANEKQYIESIGNFFPYVSSKLIDSVYAQKDAISFNYPSGMHVKLYHLLTFDDLENLNSFIQILDKHNYECKILNDKFQVEVSNEMKVKEGALLTDIYVVANQAGILNGNYESFSIEEL